MLVETLTHALAHEIFSRVLDPSCVWCTAEHRGVSSYCDDCDDSEIRASCLFSFRMHKDVSQERRTQILKMLFDSMTSRVDEAFSVSPAL